MIKLKYGEDDVRIKLRLIQGELLISVLKI